MSGAQLALLPFLIFVLPVVAASAWWLKRRYTAAVVRLQAEELFRDHGAEQRSSDRRLDHAPAPALQVRIQSAESVVPALDAVDAAVGPRRLRRRVLLIHSASELVYMCALALVMAGAAAGWDALAVLGDLARAFVPFVLVPVAIAWMLQAGVPRTVMSVVSVAVVIGAFGLFSSDVDAWQSNDYGFSLGYAAIALMVSAFLRPTIRGAGLPMVASSIAGWLAFSILVAVALALEGSDEGSSTLAGMAIGIIELVLIAAAAVWCGWRTLMALSAGYAAKRFSDIQLALGTYWVLLTAFVAATLLQDPLSAFRPARRYWIALGLVAVWLLWRRSQAAALRWSGRGAAPSIGALLLLRVFKQSGRSQAFTDRFFAYWRFAAPVWMIAGPDLAGAYLEPSEFFAYLRGRLREQFVADPNEAARRVETLDDRRDPDGRFRVTEVFCTGDTWQPTVLEMMSHSAVILLDLREYSRRRRGTRYELTEVLRRAPLQKVLVLVGAHDDFSWLRAEIEGIWQEVGGYRPDAVEPLELSVLQFRTGSLAEMRGLFRAAAAAARRSSFNTIRA